jgi:hypothetical protein
MTVVGYGYDAVLGKAFYRIKNSWGFKPAGSILLPGEYPGWGEEVSTMPGSSAYTNTGHEQS